MFREIEVINISIFIVVFKSYMILNIGNIFELLLY